MILAYLALARLFVVFLTLPDNSRPSRYQDPDSNIGPSHLSKAAFGSFGPDPSTTTPHTLEMYRLLQSYPRPGKDSIKLNVSYFSSLLLRLFQTFCPISQYSPCIAQSRSGSFPGSKPYDPTSLAASVLVCVHVVAGRLFDLSNHGFFNVLIKTC